MITESQDRIIFALYLLEVFSDIPDSDKADAICTIHELVQSAWMATNDSTLKPLSEDASILMATHKAISAIDNAQYQAKNHPKDMP